MKKKKTYNCIAPQQAKSEIQYTLSKVENTDTASVKKLILNKIGSGQIHHESWKGFNFEK